MSVVKDLFGDDPKVNLPTVVKLCNLLCILSGHAVEMSVRDFFNSEIILSFL